MVINDTNKAQEEMVMFFIHNKCLKRCPNIMFMFSVLGKIKGQGEFKAICKAGLDETHLRINSPLTLGSVFLSNCYGYKDRLGIISGNNSSLQIFVIPGWSPPGGFIRLLSIPYTQRPCRWALLHWLELLDWGKKEQWLPFPVVLSWN